MECTEPVIAALRRATADCHRTTEALLRLDQPLSLDRYACVITTLDGFLLHWEARVGAAMPERLQAWLAARSRRPLLLRDMQALGIRRCTWPDDPTAGLQLDSLAAVFGSLYVVEGSALGGLVMARQLSRDWGLSARHGAAYFQGHGQDTARLWREFRQRLEQEAGTRPADIEAACRAGVQTFEALACAHAHVMALGSTRANPCPTPPPLRHDAALA